MKFSILILSFLVTGCPSIVGCAQTPDGSSKRSGLAVDSFMYHYKRLDSLINASPFDTSNACAYSVHYMERVTSMKAHPEGNYLGWMAFTQKDLISSKEWYDKNKKKR